VSLLTELKRRNVVRAAALYAVGSWLILQVVDVTDGVLGLPEWTMRLVAFLLALGFPLAVIFSWIYEITPDGIKRESKLDRSTLDNSETTRRLNVVVIALLIIAIGLFAWQQYRGQSTEPLSSTAQNGVGGTMTIDSIAVLPFEDFSPNRDQGYLAEGIADTLLHMLSQLEGLRVAARTSSFSYRDKNLDIATIGGELGVGAILEGSVQRSNDTLRVIAQLIRVSDQSHLWSKTFDRPDDDIFAIQDEIARDVATTLRPDLLTSTDPASGRTSVEAYEQYLRGSQLWQRRNAEDIEAAIDAFRATISLDPNFAPGHAGLARAFLFSSYYGVRVREDVEALVETEVERALQLDPSLADAYATLGLLRRDQNRIAESIELLEKAVELNPNDSLAMTWLGGGYSSLGRFSDAISLNARAYEIDPLNTFVSGQYAALKAETGDTEGAIALFRRNITLEPDSPLPYSMLSQTYAATGRLDLAVPPLLQAIEKTPGSAQHLVGIAMLYLFLEDQETAETYMARARELNPRIEYDNYWFLRPGDEKRLVGNARARLERHPDQPEYQASLAEALATIGDLAAAAEYYERALAATRSPDGKAVTGRNLYWAASYAWTLDQLGRRDEGEALMREVRAVLASLDDISYSGSALILFELLDHSWRDDREAVLDTAERLADSGYIQTRFIESAPMLQRWAEEPRFAAAVMSLRERLAAQRETLRAQGL
jgi:TolB-like protein/Flp pilus assembly protein TadD